MKSDLSRRGNLATVIPAALLLVSLGSLAVAFAGQYLFGLRPCILCLYERVPYAIAAILAAIALALPPATPWRARLVGLAGAVFAAGAALAFYHVGVEQHWWGSIAACGGELATDLGADDLRSIGAGDLKPCDRVDWRLLGVSLAGYNVIISSVLAAACFAGARVLARRDQIS